MGNRVAKKVVNKVQLHTYLITIESKLKQLKNKKINEIIILLKDKNIVLAKLKADLVIRDNMLTTACDLLICHTQTLIEKITYILHSQTPPEDIREVLDTLIWSSLLLSDNIPEFANFRDAIEIHYGRQYIESITFINPLIKQKLAVAEINDNILTQELKKISMTNCIDIHFPEEIVIK
jgi:hypothetical protein